MALKSDAWIRRMSAQGMLEPYAPYQVKQLDYTGQRGAVSYGVTSYGYDMRVANEWRLFKSAATLAEESVVPVIDPKANNLDTLMYYQESDVLVMPPHSFVLCRSVERFNIPREVGVVVVGKSTYARCGLVVNCTPLEPEWQGYVTIELINTAPYPLKVYANEGIAQCLFFDSDEVCEISYADKQGKYQHQVGIVMPVVQHHK